MGKDAGLLKSDKTGLYFKKITLAAMWRMLKRKSGIIKTGLKPLQGNAQD